MPNPIYIYVLNIYDLVWFSLVLMYINHCKLFNSKSFLYTYIKYIWFGWVLWHINHCMLFNAKYYTHTHTHTHIHIYIYMIWFGFMAFQP